MDQLTSSQLSEWEAYDRLDPVGEWREDFRWAYLESMISNISRAIYGKKGVKMTSIEDFIPGWGEGKEERRTPKVQSVEEMKQFLLSMARIQNAKVKRMKSLKNDPPTKRK